MWWKTNTISDEKKVSEAEMQKEPEPSSEIKQIDDEEENIIEEKSPNDNPEGEDKQEEKLSEDEHHSENVQEQLEGEYRVPHFQVEDDEEENTKQPNISLTDFLHIKKESVIYVLILNKKAVGYANTKKEAIDCMWASTRKLKNNFCIENRIQSSRAYIREIDENTLQVMVEKFPMGIFSYFSIHDELKVVEVNAMSLE